MSGTRRWLCGLVLAAVAGLVTVPIAPAQPAHAALACPQQKSITDPLPDRPWPLRRLRPDLVWPLTTGEGIVVAVIDSGTSHNHPALKGQVLAGADFLEPGGIGDCDEAGHGTIIAGIIAGLKTGDSGFHGVAPGAKILPIRVLRDDKRETTGDAPIRIANAIRTATDRGADVINLSLTTAPTPALESAVEYAVSHNVVVVAAAGNLTAAPQPGTKPAPMYPAAYPGVIGVAGVDENGDHVPSSVFGDWVDIAAPGLAIAGPAPRGGGYATYDAGGTSFAAAYVSGTVALLRAFRSDLTAAAVARRILATADRPADGWDEFVGNGVVNPYWAISSIPENETGIETLGKITLPDPVADPLSRTRVVATFATLGSVGLSVLVLTGAWVLRRGRRRGWRPGRDEIYSA
ncbi:MAG TPA: type VII secretion-associated serine protease mycosin [Micromonosporaceae bacterium]|nr:type VII secretion-associated serine protease mycosin [Micromonosporaceae bacterium]